MKDYLRKYALGKRINPSDFFTSYEVVDDKIVVHFADGKEARIDYIKETEDAILLAMEKQAKNLYVPRSVAEPVDLFRGVLHFFIGTSWLLLAIANKSIGLACACAVFYTISSLELGCIVYEKIKTKKDKAEVAKLQFFIENKKELNKKVNTKNDLTKGLSHKAVDEMEKQHEQGITDLTINNIDNFSYKDLVKLRDNLLAYSEEEKQETFGDVIKPNEGFQKKFGER